jgi:hypothetical protein
VLVGARVIVIPGRGRKPASPESIITKQEVRDASCHLTVTNGPGDSPRVESTVASVKMAFLA